MTERTEAERQYLFMEKCSQYVTAESKRLGRPLYYYVQTFGCQMNARDSEKLEGILERIGYLPAESEECDFVLYNTCTVRENANNKVYGRLGMLARYKKKNPSMLLALCGCMMQEDVVLEKIRTSYGFIDLVFGTHNIYKLAELLWRRIEAGSMIMDIWKDTDQIVEELPVKRKYPFKSGVNIMFGCNNFCSYCIVPYVRGRERSRRPEDILREIKSLAADGVREVMLLGQNVNSYGKNLEEPIRFAELLRMVNEVDGIERIRFMTSHPKDLSDELILAMQECDKVCRHLHLPLQSGSSRLLKLMNRHYDKEQYLALADKIRTAMPDISLTTDIIVGFPGETEADFNETMDVVRRVAYESAFTFVYSRRTGTPAASMPDQVPPEEIKVHFDVLLKTVQEIAAQKAARLTGEVLPVLMEEQDEQDSSMITGRLGNNSVVHVPGSADMLGRIYPVKLLECKGFYYFGRICDETQTLKE